MGGPSVEEVRDPPLACLRKANNPGAPGQARRPRGDAGKAPREVAGGAAGTPKPACAEM